MSREEQPATQEDTVTVTAETAITVTRGETLTIGNSQFYTRGNKPTATLVTVNDGETFLEIGGTLYAQCGWCEYGTKSWHGNVFSGVCFQCDGRGYDREVGTVEVAAKRVHNRALRQARNARKEADKAAAAQTAGAEWRAANEDLADALAAIYAELAEVSDNFTYDAHTALEAKWSDFVLQMANTVGMGHALTTNQTVSVTDAIETAIVEEAAKLARQNASRWLGQEKDKVTATGTVKVAMPIEVENYATKMPETKMLIIIEGTGEFTGVTFKIFGTGKTLWETERGQDVTVSGTVKKHSERDDIKQTELTRAKITPTAGA
jgi:hypothetical protein